VLSDIEKLKNLIKKIAMEQGFLSCSFVKSTSLEEERDRFAKWLKEGRNGPFDFLSKTFDIRINPASSSMFRNASMLVIFSAFYPVIVPPAFSLASCISSYARCSDYHRVMKNQIKKVLKRVTLEYGSFKYKVFCDSSPVLEKAWARKSGMGWIGKNSLLLIPRVGSTIVLGGAFIDIAIEPNNLGRGEEGEEGNGDGGDDCDWGKVYWVGSNGSNNLGEDPNYNNLGEDNYNLGEDNCENCEDNFPNSNSQEDYLAKDGSNKDGYGYGCGDCDICITSCPTGAIVSERIVDARLCASTYTTSPVSVDLDTLSFFIKKSGSAFGCDVCQKVCPYNNISKNRDKIITFLKPDEIFNSITIKEALEMPLSHLDLLIKKTAISWIGVERFHRNLLCFSKGVL